MEAVVLITKMGADVLGIHALWPVFLILTRLRKGLESVKYKVNPFRLGGSLPLIVSV